MASTVCKSPEMEIVRMGTASKNGPASLYSVSTSTAVSFTACSEPFLKREFFHLQTKLKMWRSLMMNQSSPWEKAVGFGPDGGCVGWVRCLIHGTVRCMIHSYTICRELNQALRQMQCKCNALATMTAVQYVQGSVKVRTLYGSLVSLAIVWSSLRSLPH